MTPLDDIWLRAAAELGIPVVRGGDAYVHFDGERLHIADDAALDSDDTVAQLVLHELCHALVQGPENARVADWGLDNTSDRDEQRERACVRLQAHLTGGYGLRGTLFPTTVVRAFFEALPDDALGQGMRDGDRDAHEPERAHESNDESVQLARVAATRAGVRPFGPVLREALRESAALVIGEGARHHKSGHALGASGKRCGDCVWRTDGGFCRQSIRRALVTVDEPACVRHEGALDCLTCGACCRSAYDSVTVSPRDAVRTLHPSLVVYRSSYMELLRSGDRCAALEGTPGGPFRCTIYEDRPRTCRDFEAGGRHCLDARRRVGLTAG